MWINGRQVLWGILGLTAKTVFAVDHFEFSYSASPLTCVPESISVTACANASCSETVASPLWLSLSQPNSNAAAWVGGNVLTLQNGVGTAVLQGLSNVPVTLAVTQAQMPGSNTNIAQGKTAIQSSLASGGLPQRAVDGNRNGDYFAQSSVTHTAIEDNPWWQVDLAAVNYIDNITLFNRTDCCSDRLSNFWLLVGPEDMQGRSLNELLADNRIYRRYVETLSNNSINLTVNTWGRFARIQKTQNGVLSLAEVEVYGSTALVNVTSSSRCRRNGAAANQQDCTFSFADSGFAISVPDKFAGQPVTAQVKAVKKDDAGTACVPAFANTTKTINLWSQFDSPANPYPSANPPRIRLTDNNQDIGLSQSDATPINVTFDSQGQADIGLNYADAGSVFLNATYTGSGDDTGLVMTGSNRFISAPVGLCVQSPANCVAGDASCPVFQAAGTAFTLKVSGRAWQANDDGNLCNNPITPNYQQDNIKLGSQLVSPQRGQNGALLYSSYNHLVSPSGHNDIAQAISEVGVFEFTADPPAGYLGSSIDIPSASSGPVGRFVPKEFVVSDTFLTPGCGIAGSGFSYMGQGFEVDMRLTARNANQERTYNYFSATEDGEDYTRARAEWAAENGNNGLDLGARLTPIDELNWQQGEVFLSRHSTEFNRPLPPLVDGPFTVLDIGIRVVDQDGVATLVNPNMAAEQVGNCLDEPNTCTATLVGSQQLLFGRMTMDNVFGPENTVLKMPLRAEYWNGQRWDTNRLDNCTLAGPGSYQFSTVLATDEDDEDGHNFEPDLLSGQNIYRSGSGSMSQGDFSLLWRATSGSSAPRYRGRVVAPLQVPLWLKYYWNWDSSDPNANLDPRAGAYFGVFRGHDRVINWREQE